MKILSMLTLGIAVSMLSACSTETLPREGNTGEALHTGVSEAELSMLLAPEPGATAADYEARTHRYRLFGVQLSQVPSESFATLAETSTWETRNLYVGELLGRNLRVTAITPEGLQLTGAEGARVLSVGRDVPLRVIHHRFDRAAVHEGRLHWRVKGDVVARIRGQFGPAARAESVKVFPEPAIRLTHVQEAGVLARLGFREGDLLFSMNGERLTPDNLGSLADRLTEPGSTVRLEVFRESAFQTLTFTVDGP
ncbi:hypothetical protein HPC49_09730 [Pyxidicoccus fallax]|uniref:PDZ domain-containing protein n=1 Tax=Pyxidicoccus fallax TaxID=394095 RepID=A0A848L4I4_9BACT|nr:hypothetical protein [Pyxidicoccus fallax]NMO13526.1 hypothetical protein [Pyxidicoccus fallax]NPC78523.1 hypothetical protein [Pyxidicoccus fallax]